MKYKYITHNLFVNYKNIIMTSLDMFIIRNIFVKMSYNDKISLNCILCEQIVDKMQKNIIDDFQNKMEESSIRFYRKYLELQSCKFSTIVKFLEHSLTIFGHIFLLEHQKLKNVFIKKINEWDVGVIKRYSTHALTAYYVKLREYFLNTYKPHDKKDIIFVTPKDPINLIVYI